MDEGLEFPNGLSAPSYVVSDAFGEERNGKRQAFGLQAFLSVALLPSLRVTPRSIPLARRTLLVLPPGQRGGREPQAPAGRRTTVLRINKMTYFFCSNLSIILHKALWG